MKFTLANSINRGHISNHDHVCMYVDVTAFDDYLKHRPHIRKYLFNLFLFW